jgi:hypothetical protein
VKLARTLSRNSRLNHVFTARNFFSILHNINYAKSQTGPISLKPHEYGMQQSKGRTFSDVRPFFLGETKMRYPNLRYGNPAELRHYAQFIQPKDLAKRLRRDERTIRNWLTEREKLPWWVPEIIRLQKMENDEMLRQMNMKPQPLRLGLVTGEVIEFRRSSSLDDGLVDRVNDTTDKFLVLAG